ncbi:MAG: hypothetical protein ACLQJR_26550 [Stellaceae bacterium]
MEDETALRDRIERYRQILKGVTDKQLSRVLENMIQEGERKLDELECERENQSALERRTVPS